jgi:hypothetical protein
LALNHVITLIRSFGPDQVAMLGASNFAEVFFQQVNMFLIPVGLDKAITP